MSNDLISRKYMKEAIEQFFVKVRYYHPYSKGRKTIPTEEVLDIIDNAPTVPIPVDQNVWESGYECGKNERPQVEWGKWVISEIRCPNCLEYFQTDCYSTEELKKCPNCGAKMKGD